MNVFQFSKRIMNLGLGESRNRLSRIRTEKIEAGIHIVDLSNSNPTTVGIEFPSEAFSHYFDKNAISTYSPDPKGSEGAREAISGYYRSKSISLLKEDLILTASTSESYSYLFRLLTNPGDEILIPSPGYPLFSFLTALENLHTVEYPLTEMEDGSWQYSFEDMEKLVSTKTKMVLLVCPANPTGSYLNANEWKKWIDWSAEKSIPLVLDEVFSSYHFSNNNHISYPNTDFAPVFVLNGISKLLALPQLKLGWIHVQGNASFKANAIEGLEILADTFLSVNAPIQNLLPDLLKWQPMIESQINNRIRRNVSIAKSVFSEFINLIWKTGPAGWYGWLEIKESKFGDSEESAEQILSELNLYLHPGEWYGFPSNRCLLVVSLILPEDQFFGAIKELGSFLK